MIEFLGELQKANITDSVIVSFEENISHKLLMITGTI